MRLSLLGPRTTRRYAKVIIIFLGCVVLWWETIEISRCAGLGKYAFWLALPFFVVAIVAWAGLFNLGPFKDGFTKAIKEDQKEYNQSLTAKQPWER